MSAEIVNLRNARKRAARSKDEKEAAERRVAHGTPKRLRQEIKAKRDRAQRELDGHRRGPADE
jgi:F0F1-type ATP synthase membrane subunit b/b'